MYIGIQAHKYGQTTLAKQIVIGLLEEHVYVVPRYLRSFFVQPERIILDIDHEDFQRLAYHREEALAAGFEGNMQGSLDSSTEDLVDATVEHTGERMKAEIRLKGKRPDHFQDPKKWSFRVVMKGDNTLLGMKQFSLQHPRTRGYLNEWIFHAFFKKENFVALRYDFVELVVNGKSFGIYALEEHFDKRLVEHNEYREGPIVRFDDYLPWHAFPQTPIEETNLYALPIDAFQTGKTLKNPQLQNQFIDAFSLLEGLKRGRVSVDEVFHIEKLATVFAISDLLGNYHPTTLINLRFYYNPVLARLEPIAYDNQTISAVMSPKEFQGFRTDNEGWHALLFQNKNFVRAYTQAVQRVAEPGYIDAVFNLYNNEINKNLSILHKSFPWYNFQYKRVLYANQEKMNEFLFPVQALLAYKNDQAEDSDELVSFQISNMYGYPVEVIGIQVNNQKVYLDNEKIVYLPHRKINTAMDMETIVFQLPEKFNSFVKKEYQLIYRLAGAKNIELFNPVYPYSYLDESYLSDRFSLFQNKSSLLPFVKQNGKDFIIPKGDWIVDKDLFVPKNARLVIEAGTSITLVDNANIIIQGALVAIGTKDAPIYISGENGQGIFVVEASPVRSEIVHTHFRGLKAPQKEKWGLTGAVTFYESPVDIAYSSFKDNESEDSINIIRSDFSFHHVRIEGASSDAFDGDFVTGIITDTSVIDPQNDGIDVSGSDIAIERVFVGGAGDKAISLGEQSYADITELSVEQSNIGIAVKDKSDAVASNMDINESNIGFAVYQKKSEFGPGMLNLSSVTLHNIKTPYLIEERSSIFLNGSLMQGTAEDVYDQLYSGE